MDPSELPEFKDMPPVKGMPHGCAWGLFDQKGKRDQIGTINFLTPANTLKARTEIQTGESIALNWPLQNVNQPGFGRAAMNHKIVDLKPEFVCYDDVITINTQASSQWDGLRHWAHQDSELYYNGLEHAKIADHSCKDNGIEHWSKHGGFVARGILIDYHSWAKKKGIDHPATKRHEIHIRDIEEIAQEQNVKFRPGDILIIRSGWIDWYNHATEKERYEGATLGHEFIGLDGNEESVTWLWNHHFAAVAGDAIAFEAWPPKAPWRIHDFQIAMWGSPIGELWDLEALSAKCSEIQRWTFFLTSAPLHVVGGVASPPNAIAIF